MTIPGRAVMMVMRQRLAARSIRIWGTDADSSFFLSKVRMLRSSVSSLPNSFLSAYHFERQSRLTAMRKPIGFVFWPMLFVGKDNLDVAITFENGTGRAASFRRESLQSRGRLRHRLFDHQPVRLHSVVFGLVRFEVFGVGHGGVE